jgi:hypothetical protein
MKARILFLVGSLVLAACREPPVSSGEPHVSSDEPQIATPTPSPAVVYLARRVAIATEETLYGLEAGTELKLIDERPASLLVEAEGMQFEIDPRDVTNDRQQAERLLAHAKKGRAIRQSAVATRWQIEDQRFLAEENLRRLAADEAHLRNAVDQPRRR